MEQMKLAEALSKRNELQKFIARMEYQLTSVARIQEGDDMEDDPGELIRIIEQSLFRLEVLTAQINKTNMQIILPNGKTLTEMIASRDRLTRIVSILHKLTKVLLTKENRYSHSEIRYRNTIGVRTVRHMMDTYARQLRETDTDIQKANWKYDFCK